MLLIENGKDKCTIRDAICKAELIFDKNYWFGRRVPSYRSLRKQVDQGNVSIVSFHGRKMNAEVSLELAEIITESVGGQNAIFKKGALKTQSGEVPCGALLKIYADGLIYVEGDQICIRDARRITLYICSVKDNRGLDIESILNKRIHKTIRESSCLQKPAI